MRKIYVITALFSIVLVVVAAGGMVAGTAVTINSVGVEPLEGSIHPWMSNGTINGNAYFSSLDAGIEWDTDDNNWGSYECYLSFSLSSIPADATIQSATLYVYQYYTQEFHSQSLIFSKVDFGTLEFEDYALTGTQFGTSDNDTQGIWLSVPVTPATLIDPSEEYFQVKIYMERPKGDGFPLAQFSTALHSVHNQNVPYLYVTYEERPESNWSPISMQPLVRTMLGTAHAQWQCIEPYFAECDDADVLAMMDEIQAHMQRAASIANPMEAGGELNKAVALMDELAVRLACPCANQ